MKKLVLLMALSIFLVGCSPSDAQIETAIEQTKIAQPTDTPTITPSPTPDIRHIDGLTYDEVLTMFLASDILCVDREVNDGGSYEQECNGALLNGLIQGKINGESRDTVYAYSVSYVPFIGEDLYDEMEETFSRFISFGENAGEMKIWLDNNIQSVLNTEGLKVEYFEISNFTVVLTGGSDYFGMLDIVANSD